MRLEKEKVMSKYLEHHCWEIENTQEIEGVRENRRGRERFLAAEAGRSGTEEEALEKNSI